ncbi:MAG TPA: ABC transporter permease [Pseudonocardiaceae bacterium]|jgi:NitT/TauT family transport system permease protein|nr:ABC transporter permease [Pseudonocardiaceae bacterium]
MSLTATAATADNERFTLDPSVARQNRRRRFGVYASRAAVFVVIFGGWQWFTQLGIVDQFFFGQPTKIVKQAMDWFSNGTPYGSLWSQIGVTLEETVLGFVIGVVLGVIFGIALGRVRFLADVLGPYIKIVNSIPRIVLGAIFTVAFGLGLESKVLLAVVLVFFSVFFNAFQGAREVDRNLISNARILGASRGQVTRQVVLPSAFTWILASMHVSFGFALIGAIVGEYMGAQQGLGLLISQSQNTFNPNGVFAAMFIIAILALVAEGLITLLERRLLAWRPPVLSGDAPGA